MPTRKKFDLSLGLPPLSGAEIQKLRTEKWGMTIEQLAKVLRVSTFTINSWETGRRTPRGPDDKLLKILKQGLLHHKTLEML